MKEYEIHGVVSVSCWTKVKAESKEEAIKKAEDRDLAELHIDGMDSEDECFHFSNDGRPQKLRIEKEVELND